MASAPMAQPTRPRSGLYEWQRFTYRYLGPGLRYIVLIALALLFLFPFYLMIRTAVITQPEVASFDWVWWPQETHWRENLEGIFNDQTAPMSVGLRNSAIIAGANLLLQTLFASMAGYALARLPVRGSSLVFFLILSTLMVPSAVGCSTGVASAGLSMCGRRMPKATKRAGRSPTTGTPRRARSTFCGRSGGLPAVSTALKNIC